MFEGDLPSDQNASGRSLGIEEIRLVSEAIESGTLTATKGSFARRLEEEFAAKLGVRHAIACSSGTAAIHAAIAVVDPSPGEEVITTAITDMGAIAPILYQTAIPVFADVDPRTLTVTAASIAACISSRTRAIIATHLFGSPCEMDEIVAVAKAHDLPVIEDCAQAYLAESGGRLVGGIGTVGCFSLQQGKHITTGEGGLLVTNDSEIAHRLRLFINKAWDYSAASSDHGFLALNYRISELQAAVGLAQLRKLDEGVRRRTTMAQILSNRLAGETGLDTPSCRSGDLHTYWRYCLRVTNRYFPGGPEALAAALRERGIASSPNYIKKPAFECGLFQDQRTFGNSSFPFTLALPAAVDYSPERFPGTFVGLREALVLPWNERYTEEQIAHIGNSVCEALQSLMPSLQHVPGR